MNPTVKTILIWVLILFIAVGLWNFVERNTSVSTISYTEFLNAVDKGEVTAVTIKGSIVEGQSRNTHRAFEVAIPEGQAAIYEKLVAKKVQVTVVPTGQDWLTPFASWIFSVFAAFGLGWMCARWSQRQQSASTMAV